MEKKKECPNKLLTILMVVCVMLSVVILGIVSYDKFIKKEEKEEIKHSICNCPVCENNSNLGEKINSVKEIEITNANQNYKIGDNEIILRKDDLGHLVVNNSVTKSTHNNSEVDFYHAYLTDKFIFFTTTGNVDETINYAINENGAEITVSDSQYLLHDFKIKNGYLHADGYVFCGIDCPATAKDLLIKYIDNTLIVTEAK